MRYLNIKDIKFTTVTGTEKILKDLRPLITYDRLFEYQNKGEYLDQIAVQLYGKDAEPLWYRIADQNIKQIVSRKFNISKIKVYEIPAR